MDAAARASAFAVTSTSGEAFPPAWPRTRADYPRNSPPRSPVRRYLSSWQPEFGRLRLRMRGQPLLGGQHFRHQPIRGNGCERRIMVNQTRPQRPRTLSARAPRRVRRGNCGGGNDNVSRSARSNPRLFLGTSSRVHGMYMGCTPDVHADRAARARLGKLGIAGG
jgi:hypothetical protein